MDQSQLTDLEPLGWSGPSLLARPAFWLGGALSLAAWTAIGVLVM